MAWGSFGKRMTPLPAPPSTLLQGGFVAVSALLVGVFAYVLRSRGFLLAGAAWLALTGGIAASGVLTDFSSTPPRILLLFLPTFVGTIASGLTRPGERLARLPLTFLVGFQAFRIAVEFLIHRAATEGVAPPQMSWNGYNFDVLSGISALLLFSFVERLPRWLVLAWNLMALGLLAWVVGIAILSFPTTFQRLKPDNVWVAHFPFVWLPTVAVAAALAGHVAVFRKLWRGA